MSIEISDTTLIPIIVAIVSIVRKMGVPPRFLPAISLLLGICAGVVYVAPDDLKQGILSGIILGLMATGAWSGVKNTFDFKNDR